MGLLLLCLEPPGPRERLRAGGKRFRDLRFTRKYAIICIAGDLVGARYGLDCGSDVLWLTPS
jgi:hypothetical protein